MEIGLDEGGMMGLRLAAPPHESLAGTATACSSLSAVEGSSEQARAVCACLAAGSSRRWAPVPQAAGAAGSHLRGIVAGPEVQPLLALAVGGRRQHHIRLVCRGGASEQGMNAGLLPEARRLRAVGGSRRRSCRYKPCAASAGPALAVGP